MFTVRGWYAMLFVINMPNCSKGCSKVSVRFILTVEIEKKTIAGPDQQNTGVSLSSTNMIVPWIFFALR